MSEIIQQFISLAERHKDVSRYAVIGKTVNGNSIYAFWFGRGKYKILYDGAIHGDETVGSRLLLRFANWLLESNDPLARNMLNDVTTVIIPVLNIDSYGVKRQNANCVDLNRNFPEGYGGPGSYPGMCCPICRGYNPLDQPESKALFDFFKAEMPYIYLNIHGGTEAFTYPWSCYYDPPKDIDFFRRLGDRYLEIAKQRGVEPYPYGQTIDVKHDMAIEVHIGPRVIYQACGTATDSAYRLGIYSFVLEAFYEKSPPDSSIDYIFNRFLPIAQVFYEFTPHAPAPVVSTMSIMPFIFVGAVAGAVASVLSR
ncbi:MAG: hypothetical protein JZD41_03600 [Thermoproteus sp.]|nr:hypothetical protein [Thermoproteus sp.]